MLWVAFGPPPPAPEPTRNLYEEIIQPHENRIIWYHLKDRLPDVVPSAAAVRPTPARAAVRAPHTMVAGTQDENRPQQMIWLPEPEAKAPKPVPLPNVLAVAPSKLHRNFTPPPAPPPGQTATLPEETPAATLAATQAPRLPARAWVPPAAAAPTPKPVVLSEAPTAGLPPAGAPKLPPRSWVPPPAAPAPTPKAAVFSEAPSAALPATLAPAEAPRLPPRSWIPPPTAPARSVPSTLSDAPNASLPAASATLAIVGLDPSPNTKLPAPMASREAGFSAGGEVRSNGESTGSSTLVVPGLLTRGAPKDAAPATVAGIPVPRRDVMSAIRGVPNAPAAPASETPGVRVTEAPDPRLEGRTVYSIAIQMPNVTSYYGSWMVWFAESNSDSSSAAGTIRPPSPVRKVDPKYIAAAASERVEGVVRLFGVIRRDGHVDSIALIRHLDDRLDRSAAEALAKWQFEPAVRNGVPVDVDAVFEIPFRLMPLGAR